MAEDHGRDIKVVLFVDLDWDARPVVADLDVKGVEGHTDVVGAGVSLVVVAGVDQDLVEDFVQALGQGHFLLPDGLALDHVGCHWRGLH